MRHIRYSIALGMLLALIGVSATAQANDFLVVKRGNDVFVHWDLVEGWSTEQVAKTFGPEVILSERLPTSQDEESPENSAPSIGQTVTGIPINPWCQCPIGYEAALLQRLETISPPLSTDVESTIYERPLEWAAELPTESEITSFPGFEEAVPGLMAVPDALD